MKANFITKNRQLTFQIEAASPKAVWDELAAIQEIFDAEHQCGLCGSADLKHVRREVQGNDYYELRCMGKLENGYACNARFDFGQAKDKVSLFPKRRDKDGNWLNNGGWYRYQPAGKSSNSSGANNSADPWELP